MGKVLKPLPKEKIEELKKIHGELYELKIPLNDLGTEFCYGYVKRPTRAIMSAHASRSLADPIQAGDIVLRNILIPEISDSRILGEENEENDNIYYAALTCLEPLLRVRNASIKKL